MTSRLIPPIRSQQLLDKSQCALCGQRLLGAYYFLPDRPERYCETCIEQRPRCSSCAAPVGDDGWTLHDGRVQCGGCHRSAIYDPQEAQALYASTVASLAQHPGLQVQVGASFRLVDQPTIQDLARQGAIATEGQQMLGLYLRQGRMRVVYALYGLPRWRFRLVVAHEFAHVWQGEHCPLLTDYDWVEGFAEWVAYQHLLFLGATKAAERLRNAEHPYRKGLEQCLKLEEQIGIRGVLAAMRTLE
ncbi:MAG: zinc-binding protein [Chloroflexi bacterium]|nr:zinc-binding protein [Chloroflexota bacterium]